MREGVASPQVFEVQVELMVILQFFYMSMTDEEINNADLKSSTRCFKLLRALHDACREGVQLTAGGIRCIVCNHCH
jgi:hypothetical protein